MEIQTEQGLKEAFTYIEGANPSQAAKILGSLFEHEFDCPELVFTADCCNFWSPIMAELSAVEGGFARGEKLLGSWKKFQDFVARKSDIRWEPALAAVNRGIFSLALENYGKLLDTEEPVRKAEILRKVGLCCKKLGKFDEAQSRLEEANKAKEGDAAALAELADCHALCGADREAKVLFREAFFIAPQDIELDFLDARLIRLLIEKTEEKGYSGEALKRWIPVYGALWGVLTVRRAISVQEASRLKREIYELEAEMKDSACDVSLAKPRLLNLYIWLVDHLRASRVSDRQVSDILLKMRILDSAVYELYVK